MYHPDYRVTWLERIGELLETRTPARAPEGVDTTLLQRAAIRSVDAFAEGLLNVHLLGVELVRADSSWPAPPEGPAREAALGALLLRLRYEQLDITGVPHALHPRWYQLDPAPHGSRLLLRLAEPVNLGLPARLAVNLETEGGRPRWEAVAAGG